MYAIDVLLLRRLTERTTGSLRYWRFDEWDCQYQKSWYSEHCRRRMECVGKTVYLDESIVELSIGREI